jgi:hypothetical protein
VTTQSCDFYVTGFRFLNRVVCEGTIFHVGISMTIKVSSIADINRTHRTRVVSCPQESLCPL